MHRITSSTLVASCGPDASPHPRRTTSACRGFWAGCCWAWRRELRGEGKGGRRAGQKRRSARRSDPAGARRRPAAQSTRWTGRYRRCRRHRRQVDRCGDRAAAPRPRVRQPRPRHRQQPAARRDRGGSRRADPVQPRPHGTPSRRAGRAAPPFGRYCGAARKSAGGRAGLRNPDRDAAQPLRLASLRRQQGRAARRNPGARRRHRSAGQEPARRVSLFGQYRSRAVQGRRRGARVDRQPAALDRDRRQSVSGY